MRLLCPATNQGKALLFKPEVSSRGSEDVSQPPSIHAAAEESSSCGERLVCLRFPCMSGVYRNRMPISTLNIIKSRNQLNSALGR